MSRNGPHGPLPTIGHDKAQGVEGLTIFCTGRYCSQSSPISFEQLGLPDDTAIIHVTKIRRFVCSRCGSHTAEARSIWPNPREVQAKRMADKPSD